MPSGAPPAHVCLDRCRRGVLVGITRLEATTTAGDGGTVDDRLGQVPLAGRSPDPLTDRVHFTSLPVHSRTPRINTMPMTTRTGSIYGTGVTSVGGAVLAVKLSRSEAMVSST